MVLHRSFYSYACNQALMRRTHSSEDGNLQWEIICYRAGGRWGGIGCSIAGGQPSCEIDERTVIRSAFEQVLAEAVERTETRQEKRSDGPVR